MANSFVSFKLCPHGRRVIFTLLVALNFSSTVAPASEVDGFWDALKGGDPHIDLRARMELADFEGKKSSEAFTLRTRVGYTTGEFHGVSVHADLENISAADDSSYFDAVSTGNSGKSVIADPEDTELNQAYLKVRRDSYGIELITGRQRIILDDARFVGNVGWRQNEQTYDSVLFKTSLGVPKLEVSYGYLWKINRIFGNQGGAGTQDFDSSSHLINISYSGIKYLKPTIFVYALDFEDDSPGNSSTTFGFRLADQLELTDDFTVVYQGSYAHQVDAQKNTANYGANYVLVDAKLGYKGWGWLGIGFEMLGSDNGDGRFVTPLATAHKFNGWADAFLDNGGADGLQDLYFYLAPKLPWELEGKLVYHRFEADHGGLDLGYEIDAVLSRRFMGHLTILAKVAHYDGGDSARADRTRFWLQGSVAF